MSAARAAVAWQVAELVEDQERRAGVPLEPAPEGGKRFLLEEIGERGGQRGEADRLAREQGGMAEVLREHGLADTGLTAQEHVLATADEVEGGEALDERAVDLARMGPVESVERLERAEVGGARAACEVGGLAGAGPVRRDLERHEYQTSVEDPIPDAASGPASRHPGSSTPSAARISRTAYRSEGSVVGQASNTGASTFANVR